jgi:hypothetical protein
MSALELNSTTAIKIIIHHTANPVTTLIKIFPLFSQMETFSYPFC